MYSGSGSIENVVPKLTFEMLTVRGQHWFSAHQLMFLWKCRSFRGRKCLDPNIQIHAECSNHWCCQDICCPMLILYIYIYVCVCPCVCVCVKPGVALLWRPKNTQISLSFSDAIITKSSLFSLSRKNIISSCHIIWVSLHFAIILQNPKLIMKFTPFTHTMYHKGHRFSDDHVTPEHVVCVVSHGN